MSVDVLMIKQVVWINQPPLVILIAAVSIMAEYRTMHDKFELPRFSVNVMSVKQAVWINQPPLVILIAAASIMTAYKTRLLYTSDAADDAFGVVLGNRAVMIKQTPLVLIIAAGSIMTE